MMKNFNHQNQNCTFAEEIVSYLYDEIPANRKAVFEKHLAGCDACAVEIAEFSGIRFSIGEWRKAEFERLPTPLIEIPRPTETVAATAGKSSDVRSWLETLRRSFSFGWTPAAAALAVLVLGAGLMYFNFNLSAGSEYAGLENKNAAAPVKLPETAPPTLETPGEQTIVKRQMPTRSNDSAETATAAPKESRAETAKVESAPAEIPAKIVKASAPKPVDSRPVTEPVSPKNGKAPINRRQNVNPVRNQPAPTLNAFEEDEDESLRLADLFAEIETRK